MLRIKLIRSPIGQTPRNRATVQALGLRKIGQTVEKEDTPVFRGMVEAVRHMVVATADGADKPYVDGRTIRKHATRKDKKPSETH